MQKNEEPGLVEQALLMVAAFATVYGFAVIVLSLEHKNAPQAPATTGKGSPPSSLSTGQPAALLSLPIPYVATVTQSGDGIDEPRTRFYVPKSVRELK